MSEAAITTGGLPRDSQRLHPLGDSLDAVWGLLDAGATPMADKVQGVWRSVPTDTLPSRPRKSPALTRGCPQDLQKARMSVSFNGKGRPFGDGRELKDDGNIRGRI